MYTPKWSQATRLLTAAGYSAHTPLIPRNSSLNVGACGRDGSMNGADLQETFLEEQEASRRLAPPCRLLIYLFVFCLFLFLSYYSNNFNIICREGSIERYIAAEEHISYHKLGISYPYYSKHNCNWSQTFANATPGTIRTHTRRMPRNQHAYKLY